MINYGLISNRKDTFNYVTKKKEIKMEADGVDKERRHFQVEGTIFFVKEVVGQRERSTKNW